MSKIINEIVQYVSKILEKDSWKNHENSDHIELKQKIIDMKENFVLKDEFSESYTLWSESKDKENIDMTQSNIDLKAKLAEINEETEEKSKLESSVDKDLEFNINSYKSNIEKVDQILKDFKVNSYNTNFSFANNVEGKYAKDDISSLWDNSSKPQKLTAEHQRNKTKLSGLMHQAKTGIPSISSKPKIQNFKNSPEEIQEFNSIWKHLNGKFFNF